ncbi:MAG: YitT family protein [Bacteroidota bacterium]
MSKSVLLFLRSLLLIILGILSASIGLKGFLLPNGFYDGGVMGIALLLNELLGLHLSYGVILVNLPFVLGGIRYNSYAFFIKTVIAISCLALLLELVSYPIFTEDKLLVSVFGGFFLGGGIGLTIRGGAVIDGTEVLAIYISRKTILSVGDVITIVNLIIFSVAALLTNIEVALYALLTYLVASKTVDFIIHGLEGYSSVLIISEESDKIRKVITEDLGHGVSIFKGERGYQKINEAGVEGQPASLAQELDILYSVVSRLEVIRIQNAIEKIDPNAFIIQQRIDDTKGGMIRKREY